MKIDALLLILDDEHWQMSGLCQQQVVQETTSNWPSATQRDHPQLIQNLQTTLSNWQYTNQPVIITLPDHWCICTTQNQDLSRQSRQNVLYAFEAKWPVAIEDVVADYLSTKDTTLGVCVELNRLSQIINALEPLQLNISAICPKSLIVLQQLQSISPDALEHHTVLANGKANNWFSFRDRKPIAWKWLDKDVKNLLLQTQTLCMSGQNNLHIKTAGVAETTISQLKAMEHVVEVSPVTTDMDSCLIQSASRLATGKVRPWINLLRPPLVSNTQQQTKQRILGLLLLAVLLLGLSLIGSITWRGMTYRNIAHENQIWQQKIFRDIFPESRRVPLNIANRLDSELRNILDHASLLPNTMQTPQQTSALILLHESLLHLPAELPMHIQEIRMDKNRIDLRGVTSEHAQVQLIAKSLQANPNLEVLTPQMTQTTTGEIRYTIIAQFQPSPTQRAGQ